MHAGGQRGVPAVCGERKQITKRRSMLEEGICGNASVLVL